MRGAGCTINDMADREFDRKVARTADRPLASGAVSYVSSAFLFLGLLLAVGLAVLLQFNAFAVTMGILALPLVVTYPFMKRITYWPQSWLGLTFNWGALMGWAAVRGELAAPAVALYVAGIFWTLGYDTSTPIRTRRTICWSGSRARPCDWARPRGPGCSGSSSGRSR